LGLPEPDYNLGVGSGSHAAQTAEIMRKFEEVLLRERPDVLIVVGDVNSTLACALVAAKISFDASGRRPLIAHVEAGLRSFDRTMPEEVNRVLTDQVSDILFTTERGALDNLTREGVPAEKVRFVGNTMIDSLLAYRDKANASAILHTLGLCSGAANGNSGRSTAPYALLTLHRPANVDSRDAFLNIVEGLDELCGQCAVVFPAHPRTRQRIADFALHGHFSAGPPRAGKIGIIEPLGYIDFLCLMSHAKLVVTDSGGIQEETTCLGIPCVTVRENTERPITVENGTNMLAGVRKDGIREAVRRQLEKTFSNEAPPKWDGGAAGRIVEILLSASHVRSVDRGARRESTVFENVDLSKGAAARLDRSGLAGPRDSTCPLS
jgi:UDP-N-acetylglucosamine 2-epimerase (non-hydrolysing)